MLNTPSVLDRCHQGFFDAIYSRSLLYNTCWEDPALDRVALALSRDDSILVITSAGCNALDYALEGPRRIDAVDANPRQTALLELKIAGIRHLDHQDFFALFGQGRHARFEDMYFSVLRRDLSPFAQSYWDNRLHWFCAVNRRDGFYFQGLAGLVARGFRTLIEGNHRLHDSLITLLHATSLDQQQDIYDTQIDPHLWSKGMNWAVSRRATMSLLGVPYPQARAVELSHEHGIAGFIRGCIRFVFRQLPIWTNYFWTVYLRGSYTQSCCPEYLTAPGFTALKNGLVDAIVPHTATITQFLEQGHQPISRFVLLDHMDWMSSFYPQALAQEWTALLRRATPNARVLFRSASADTAFLDTLQVGHPDRPDRPVRVQDILRYDRPLAERLHAQDRVHTYASFHVADLAVP